MPACLPACLPAVRMPQSLWHKFLRPLNPSRTNAIAIKSYPSTAQLQNLIMSYGERN